MCSVTKSRLSLIMREDIDSLGMHVQCYNSNNLRYADDAVQIDENAADLQQTSDIVIIDSAKSLSLYIT